MQLKTNQLDRLNALTKKFANDDEFQEYLALFSLWSEFRNVPDKFKFMLVEQTNVILKQKGGNE